MLPVDPPPVAPFGRWPDRGSVVDGATILDDPDRPARFAVPLPALRPVRRCRDCKRRCRGELRDGLGPKCWAKVNARPRRPRARRPAAVEHAGPDLLDLLAPTRPNEETQMVKPANPECVRCGHVANLHRLDDAQNVGPCDPEALFRCIHPGPDTPGPLRRDCFCPDFVVPADAGWPYNGNPEPASTEGTR